MSGVCPVPATVVKVTYSDDVPTRDQLSADAPDPLFNTCVGTTYVDQVVGPRDDGTTTTINTCSLVPGPPGPNALPPGGTTGQVLVKVDDTDYNVEWADAANVTYRGPWDTDIDYKVNDFVTKDACCYICIGDHVSDSFTKPRPFDDYEPGGTYWILMSNGEEPSFMDKLKKKAKNWFDGVVDWVSDIENWGVEDYAAVALAGIGLYVAGAAVDAILDEIEEALEPDEDVLQDPVDSTWGGPVGYKGALQNVSLRTVVADICKWVGFTTYNTSRLDDVNVNITVANDVTARDLLELLSQVYFFDMVDSGGTLYFVSRASSYTPVKYLTASVDLGFTSQGSSLPPPYVMRRSQGTDLPRKITVEYSALNNAYYTMTQTASVETYTEGVDVNIKVPLSLSDQDAYNIAEMALSNAHIERMTYSFTTSYIHADLEPGDVINIDTLGDLRILSIQEDSESGLLNFVATSASYNSSTYTPSGTPAQAPKSYSDKPKIIKNSSGLVLEIPPLNSNDTTPRLTLFPHGYGVPSWPGCAIYISTDGGTSYKSYGSTADESTFGTVAIAMAAGSVASDDGTVWDELTTVDVVLATGTLESKSKLDVLNGENLAMIGREIIGFRTATLIGTKTYRLSGLLRGRKGTEPYMDNHANKEMFVLLDQTTMIDYPYSLATKDKEVKFKFVTFGSSIDKATAVSAKPSGASRRPWRPAHLKADITGSDWNISWKGRNTVNTELIDGSPAINQGGFGGYVLQILNPSTSVVVRTIVQQTSDYVYTTDQQVADFGSAQSTIRVLVSQLDLEFGPGFHVVDTFN